VREIADAAGKSASEIGLLGTAAGIAGAAMAGWQFGTWIAGITGLDKAVAHLADTYAGLPTQVEGARQDELARASERAGRAITDLTEARKINNDAVREHNLLLDTSENRIKNFNTEFERVAKAGHWQQMTADMNSHIYTLEEVSKRYDISARALDYLTREQKDNADAAKAETEAVEALFKTWDEGAKIMQEFTVTTHAIAMKAMAEERAERAKLLQETNATVITGLEQIKEAQADYTDWVLKNSLKEYDYKVAKINAWADAEINAFKGTQEQAGIYAAFIRDSAMQQIKDLEKTKEKVAEVGDEYSRMYKQATEGVLVIGHAAGEMAQANVQAAEQSANAFEQFKGVVVAGTREMAQQSGELARVMTSSITTFADYQARMLAMQQAQRDRGEFFMLGFSNAPALGMTGWNFQGRQAGGPVSPGQSYVVGERGPELFRPATSGAIVPNGGGGVVMHNTINVNGSIRDIAPQLIQELTRLMRQTRQWPAA